MKKQLVSSLYSSLKVAWMIIKVYIPFALVSALLKYLGFYEWVSPYLSPLMQIMGLPGKSAITLISGFLGNVYAAIATIPALDLSIRQITILAIIIGFSHNLIVETGILVKLKFARTKFTFFRLFIGLLSGVLLNLILPDKIDGVVVAFYTSTTEFSWITTIKSTLITCLQFSVLILVLNIMYELLKQWKYIVFIKQKLQSASGVIGLSGGAVVPWLAGFILGIVYGAGILFQFSEKKTLTHKDACLVTVFMVLAHAIIEDTLVFVFLGANFWLIFITRTLLAFIVMKIMSINNLYKKLLWIGLNKEINE